MAIEELPNDDRSRLARIGLTGDDAFLTLKEACRDCFHGSISPATLKAEAERGNLTIYKIGRGYFTTKRDIALMKEKCRVAAKPAQRSKTATERDTAVRSQAALASARLTVEKLKANRQPLRKPSDAPKRKGITAKRRRAPPDPFSA